eukprot:tig00020904_g15158.t1
MPRTLVVDASPGAAAGSHRSLRAALDAAEDGDEIRMRPGLYLDDKTIKVTKCVRIIGQGVRDKPVLQRSGAEGCVLALAGLQGVVCNVVVRPSPDARLIGGIHLCGGGEYTIEQVSVSATDGAEAVLISNRARATLRGCTIGRCRTGVLAEPEKCAVDVRDCEIAGAVADGIRICSSSFGRIKDNVIHNVRRHGIFWALATFGQCANNTVYHFGGEGIRKEPKLGVQLADNRVDSLFRPSGHVITVDGSAAPGGYDVDEEEEEEEEDGEGEGEEEEGDEEAEEEEAEAAAPAPKARPRLVRTLMAASVFMQEGDEVVLASGEHHVPSRVSIPACVRIRGRGPGAVVRGAGLLLSAPCGELKGLAVCAAGGDALVVDKSARWTLSDVHACAPAGAGLKVSAGGSAAAVGCRFVGCRAGAELAPGACLTMASCDVYGSQAAGIEVVSEGASASAERCRIHDGAGPALLVVPRPLAPVAPSTPTPPAPSAQLALRAVDLWNLPPRAPVPASVPPSSYRILPSPPPGYRHAESMQLLARYVSLALPPSRTAVALSQRPATSAGTRSVPPAPLAPGSRAAPGAAPQAPYPAPPRTAPAPSASASASAPPVPPARPGAQVPASIPEEEAGPRVLVVGDCGAAPGGLGPFATLEAALREASEGDEVRLRPGVYEYPDEIEVGEGVSIVGEEGGGGVTLRRVGCGGAVLFLNSEAGGTLRNLRVAVAAGGVGGMGVAGVVVGGGDWTLENCEVSCSGGDAAVLLNGPGTPSATLRRCRLLRCGRGVHCAPGSRARLIQCEVSLCALEGVLVESKARAELRSCTISDVAGAGLCVAAGGHCAAALGGSARDATSLARCGRGEVEGALAPLPA